MRRAGELIAFANIVPPYGPNGTARVDPMRHVGAAPRSPTDFLFANLLRWAPTQGHATFLPRRTPPARLVPRP